MLLTKTALDLEDALKRNGYSEYDIQVLCRTDVLGRVLVFVNQIDWRTDPTRGELSVCEALVSCEHLSFGQSALTKLLENIGSLTLAELAQHTDDDLRQRGGISDGSIEFIKNVLEYYNLELNPSRRMLGDRLIRDQIIAAIDTLSEKSVRLMRLHYGLEDGREHTLEEIGGIFGYSIGRMRQIEPAVRRQLRHALNLHGKRELSKKVIREALKH